MTISAVPPSLSSVLQTLGLTESPNGWNLASTEDGLSLTLNWNQDGAVTSYASPMRIKGMKSPSTLRRDHRRMQAYLQKVKSQAVSDTVTNSLHVLSTDHVSKPALSKEQAADMSAPERPPAETSSTSTQCNPETSSCAVQCITESISVGSQCSKETKSTSNQCYHLISADAQSQTGTRPKNQDSKDSSLPAAVNPKTESVCRTLVTESVAARRKCYDGEQFLIRWRDRPAKENSWVNSANLDVEAKTFINNYGYKIRGKACLVDQTLSEVQDLHSDNVTNIGVLFSNHAKEQTTREAALCLEPLKPISLKSVPQFPEYIPPAKNFDHTKTLGVHLQTTTNRNPMTIYMPAVYNVQDCIEEYIRCSPEIRNTDTSRVFAYFHYKRLKRTFSLAHDMPLNKLPNTGQPHVVNRVFAYDQMSFSLDFGGAI